MKWLKSGYKTKNENTMQEDKMDIKVVGLVVVGLCIVFGLFVHSKGNESISETQSRYEPGNYIVLNDNMRVRVSPSFNGEVVSIVDSGTFLEIDYAYKDSEQSDNIWGRTSDGWICIHSAGIDLLSTLTDKEILKNYHGYEPGTYTVSFDNMRIRKTPSIDGEVISKISKGTQLEIYDIYVDVEHPDDVWGKSSKGWICISSREKECLTLQE